MLTLRFEHPTSRQTHTVGPAPYFVIRENSLRAGPGGEEVGFYADGLWHAAGHGFTAILPDAPATVHFGEDGDPSPDPLGPFENVAVVDGAIRHGPRLGRVLARFDEDSRTWYVFAAKRRCPNAVLQPAPLANGDH